MHRSAALLLQLGGHDLDISTFSYFFAEGTFQYISATGYGDPVKLLDCIRSLTYLEFALVYFPWKLAAANFVGLLRTMNEHSPNYRLEFLPVVIIRLKFRSEPY